MSGWSVEGYKITNLSEWPSSSEIGVFSSQPIYSLVHAFIWLSKSVVQSVHCFLRRIMIPETIFAMPFRSLYKVRGIVQLSVRFSLTGYLCDSLLDRPVLVASVHS